MPPADFEENLESLAADAERAGARLLLLSESLQPDSRVLSPYWDRMETVAERHPHVAFFDTAAQTEGVGPGLFLDANHLTVAGHAFVATRLASELERLEWVVPPGR